LGQNAVIHPTLAVPPTLAGLAATPVLSHATGSPLVFGRSPGTCALRATSAQDRPSSDDRYSRTGFWDIAAPMLSSSQPWF
jgi:hypothetical protein